MKLLALVFVALMATCNLQGPADPEAPDIRVVGVPPQMDVATVDQAWVHKVEVRGAYVEVGSDGIPFYYFLVGDVNGQIGLAIGILPNDVAYRDKFYQITLTSRDLEEGKATELVIHYRIIRVPLDQLNDEMTFEEALKVILNGYTVTSTVFPLTVVQ